MFGFAKIQFSNMFKALNKENNFNAKNEWFEYILYLQNSVNVTDELPPNWVLTTMYMILFTANKNEG